MNILNIVSAIGHGGLERYALDLSNETRERGHRAVLVHPPHCFLEKQRISLDIPGYSITAGPYFDPRMIVRLISIIHGQNIDVIHCHTSRDIWYGSYMKRLFRELKLVHTQQMRPGHKDDFLHRWVYGALDHVFAITRDVKQGLIQNCGIPDSLIEVLYYGIDLERYQPDDFDPVELKREMDLNPEHPVVGYVGRIGPGKRADLFIEAALECLEDGLDLQFILVGGPGDEKDREFCQKIENTVDKSGFAGQIHFLGHREDIPRMMALMDLFCLPSECETFGKVTLEAQAMNTPVIVSDAGGADEALKPGETGVLFEPGNTHDLARKIQELIGDAQRRESMGRDGRILVEKFFSGKKHFDRVIELYRNL